MANVNPAGAKVARQITVDPETKACDPAEVELGPGDSVKWGSEAQIVVDFGERTPFQRDRFERNDVATVRDDAEEGTYTPVISVEGEPASESNDKGTIIIKRPTRG